MRAKNKSLDAFAAPRVNFLLFLTGFFSLVSFSFFLSVTFIVKVTVTIPLVCGIFSSTVVVLENEKNLLWVSRNAFRSESSRYTEARYFKIRDSNASFVPRRSELSIPRGSTLKENVHFLLDKSNLAG